VQRKSMKKAAKKKVVTNELELAPNRSPLTAIKFERRVQELKAHYTRSLKNPKEAIKHLALFRAAAEELWSDLRRCEHGSALQDDRSSMPEVIAQLAKTDAMLRELWNDRKDAERKRIKPAQVQRARKQTETAQARHAALKDFLAPKVAAAVKANPRIQFKPLCRELVPEAKQWIKTEPVFKGIPYADSMIERDIAELRAETRKQYKS
jgi:hypothetical protein